MTETTRHALMDGKVQLYMRAASPHWQCAASVAGRQRRTTTKEESLSRAKDVARDWYLGLMGKYRAGELKEGHTFKEAALRFIDEYEVVTAGQRSETHTKNTGQRLHNYLIPFFGDKVLADVTPGLVQEYRIHRLRTGRGGPGDPTWQPNPEGKGKGLYRKPPSRSTLHKEIVCIRLVLKLASRHGWLTYLPDLSAPYKTSGKVAHRAWFSPEEYKALYKATRDRAKAPPKPRWKKECENLHDFILFMVNTGLRPDEALRIEYRDVAIVTDEATGERILEIAVRGKRGVGWCKSMPGAVVPFRRLRDRNGGELTDRLFPSLQRELFNTLLDELNMKVDREGQRRTFYSLRHTYICFRLMEGADIYQIAKNCRTSVEMIENYYAAHIKNTIDAAAINVMKPKRVAKKSEATQDAVPQVKRRKPKSASTASV